MTLQQLQYVIAVEKYGSFTKAAQHLYVSQPSVSALVMDLEKELDIIIFERTAKGIILSPQGKELLKYAHQLIDEANSIKEYFQEHQSNPPVFFSVSSQHYSFAIRAFIDLEQELEQSRYVLRLKETQTLTVIEDVAKQRSELGIIVKSSYTDRHINKVLMNNNLEFHELMTCFPHVFLYKGHPLAGQESIAIEDLAGYPCIIYDQNDNIPFYLSEELIIPAYRPQKIMYTSDLLESICIMRDCNAYNIGTGVLAEGLGLEEFVGVPIRDQAPMTVGWLVPCNHKLSHQATRFMQILQHYLDKYLKKQK